MDLRILGNVEIHDGTSAVELRRAGERCVLANLALNCGYRVHIDTLVEHVWDDQPPDNAERTVANYVRSVRRAIEQSGGQRAWLSSHRPGSYQLDLDPDLVDYHRFRAGVALARRRQRDGEPAEATVAYRHAIQLRRGQVLGNLSGRWAEHLRYAIEQEYLDAVCALYEQQLAHGESSDVATSAMRLITEVTPTDRMIVLALRGLADSGQHTIIRDFTDRAARRMWESAGAKPSAEVLAMAAHLAAHPVVDVTLSSAATSDSLLTGTVGSIDDERVVEAPPERPTIVMTVSHSGQVYQAAGDQYIADGVAIDRAPH
jgi:DNA-binding SARP family transcriptional activator